MTTESTAPQPSTQTSPSSDDLVARVQELQARLDGAGDPATRQVAEELVAAVVEMYGTGLEKIFSALAAEGEAGAQMAAGLAKDPDVGSLLLIHDLHPIPLEQRVADALETVRPYIESHGGMLDLLSIENGVARIKLDGSCSDCRASSVTLELAIKQAIEEAAPDLWGLEVEGISEELVASPEAEEGFDLSVVTVGGANADDGPAPSGVGPPAWYDVGGMQGLAPGQLRVAAVAGVDLVIANVDGTLLAFRNRCAGCGSALDRGELSEGALSCPECGRSFFLPRAGRSLDDRRVQLDPVPLLQGSDGVRVALAL